MGKVVSLDYINKNLEANTATCTGGGFDLFHVGHLRYLRACSELGRPFVVIVQGDDTVRMRKGLNRPIINENERAEIVAALDFVDYVLILEKQSYSNEYLSAIRPKRYVFSKENMNYREQRASIMKEEFPEMEVIFQDITKLQSTTLIVEKVLKKEDSSHITDPVVKKLYEISTQSNSSVGRASALIIDVNESILASAHNGERGESHAEIVLLNKIKENNISLSNVTLVTNFPPCIACAREIVSSGIGNVEYVHSYGIEDGVEYLKQKGISVKKR